MDSSNTSLLDETLVNLLLMLSGIFFSSAGGGGVLVALLVDIRQTNEQETSHGTTLLSTQTSEV